MPDVPFPYVNKGDIDAPQYKRLTVERAFVVLGRMMMRPTFVVATVVAVGITVLIYRKTV